MVNKIVLIALLVFAGSGLAPDPAMSHASSAPDSASMPGPDPRVQAMIDQVETQEIYQLTGDLSGEWPVTIGGEPYTILTRYSYSGEPIHKAAQYLYEYYLELGLQTSYQDFDLFSHSLSNVEAEKTGSLYPDRIVLITSHYDDAPRNPRAPGADDNASGTVGVMLAAKILSQYDFGCTLRFVNFAGEEQGLYGSADYAQRAYAAQEDLRGVLNLDMIAWNTLNSAADMELHAQPGVPGSLEMAQLFQEVVEVYALDLNTKIISPGIGASDHASFWIYDYPAILTIEDLQDFNPYYHTPNDDLDNIPGLDFYTTMVKASLATLAHMGCLVDESQMTRIYLPQVLESD